MGKIDRVRVEADVGGAGGDRRLIEAFAGEGKLEVGRVDAALSGQRVGHRLR